MSSILTKEKFIQSLKKNLKNVEEVYNDVWNGEEEEVIEEPKPKRKPNKSAKGAKQTAKAKPAQVEESDDEPPHSPVKRTHSLPMMSGNIQFF